MASHHTLIKSQRHHNGLQVLTLCRPLLMCEYIQSILFIHSSCSINPSHSKIELAHTESLLLGEICTSIYLSVHISHVDYNLNSTNNLDW